MVIDNLKIYDEIWDWIYKTLDFCPNVDRGHDFSNGFPFRIPFVHIVYGIDQMKEVHLDRMEKLIQKVLLKVTKKGQRLFALDWQHSGFLYDPRKMRYEQENTWVKDEIHPKGGYHASFPAFYPDGDYFFFIDENLKFGYLSHPWRKEVWIFGDALVKEFEKIYPFLGWYKLYACYYSNEK